VLQAAAGGAYKFAASHEGGLSNVAVHNGALATATSYVVSNLPDTLQKLGITPDKVTAMVSARLGALLATDPTVTAGKPPVAPPVATPARSSALLWPPLSRHPHRRWGRERFGKLSPSCNECEK